MNTITLQLNAAEQNMLREMIDLALKTHGLAAMPTCSHMIAKLEAARLKEEETARVWDQVAASRGLAPNGTPLEAS